MIPCTLLAENSFSCDVTRAKAESVECIAATTSHTEFNVSVYKKLIMHSSSLPSGNGLKGRSFVVTGIGFIRLQLSSE